MRRDSSIRSKLVALGKSGLQAHILALLGTGIILTLPTLILGFPDLTDDAAQHVLLSSLFTNQFWSGDLYPRWLVDMNAGLGNPTFFYYPPLSYFITGLISFITPAGTVGWAPLGVSVSLALIFSGLGMYLWMRELAQPTAALIGALLYMIMPYHLAVDLYTRGAFAEFWAFVWMPLVLFFTSQVGKGRLFAIPGLAICYAALIMTHLPTTLVFSLVPPAYALSRTVLPDRKINFLKLIGGMSLGIGLSAIYLIPALTTQSHVYLGQVTTGYYFYENWFLFSKWKLWGDETSKLSLMLLLVLVPAAGAMYLALPDRKSRKQLLFWMWVSLVGVFMMTPLSKPVWQWIPTLQTIQFPYRINSPVTLSVAVIFALGFSSLREPITGLKTFIILIILGCICVWLIAAGLAARSAFLRFNPLPEYAAALDSRLSLKFGGWEFLPSHIKIESQEVILKKVVDGKLSPRVRVVGGKGSVSIQKWEPRNILLQADLEVDCTVHVNQLYFPGWVAEIDKGVIADVQPSEPDGLLSFRLPAGSHQVSVRLERGSQEVLGQMLSAASAGIVLILLALDYGRWRSSGGKRGRGKEGKRERGE